MAEVVLSEVRKIYAGGFEAVKGVSFDRAGRRLMRARRAVGMRQVDLLRMVGGPRDRDLRRHPHRGAPRQRSRAHGRATSPWCSRTTRSTRI